MTIRSFDLLQPRSVSEAVAMLARYGDDARPLGGGTTLVILMKQRALYYPYLVDLQTIPGLAEIKVESNGVRIGALVTVSYTHLRAHETPEHLVCRFLLE